MTDFPLPMFAPAGTAAVPLYVIDAGNLDTIPAAARGWADTCGFKAAAGSTLCIPGPNDTIAMALVGQGTAATRKRSRFAVASAATRLPAGTYAIASGLTGPALTETALGWLLESYDFARYRSAKPAAAQLVAPDGIDAARVFIWDLHPETREDCELTTHSGRKLTVPYAPFCGAILSRTVCPVFPLTRIRSVVDELSWNVQV